MDILGILKDFFEAIGLEWLVPWVLMLMLGMIKTVAAEPILSARKSRMRWVSMT
ncbi:MAG: hypothetical protein OHK0039_28360 [Bacteroidia bacterium]